VPASIGGDGATPASAFSSSRGAVIQAHPELRERELIKMAGFARTLTEALRARGVADVQAELAAEAGVAVFRTAFGRWIAGDGDRTLAAVVDDGFAALTALS